MLLYAIMDGGARRLHTLGKKLWFPTVYVKPLPTVLYCRITISVFHIVISLHKLTMTLQHAPTTNRFERAVKMGEVSKVKNRRAKYLMMKTIPYSCKNPAIHYCIAGFLQL